MSNEQLVKKLIAIRERYGMTRKEEADALGLPKRGEALIKSWEAGEEIPAVHANTIESFPMSSPYEQNDGEEHLFTFIDLFAGIGGIRLGFQQAGGKCAWTSEWDAYSQKTYKANYGVDFGIAGDITKIDASDIPDHDVILAGIPCQAFSHAGKRLGFKETRGTLFFDVARIAKAKQPKAILIENVVGLKTHDGGKTLETIIGVLGDIGYHVPEPQILDANDFGVPQHRERIFIVGIRKDIYEACGMEFEYPKPTADRGKVTVGSILQSDIPDKYTVPDGTWEYLKNKKKRGIERGTGFGYWLFDENSPHTNTITARYYKDGCEALISRGDDENPRKLTPRECARLQGFPDDFIIPVSDTRAYRQFGNSVCVPVLNAMAKQMLPFLI